MIRVLLIACFLALAAVGASWAAYERLLTPVSGSAKAQLVEVRPGEGLATVAARLERQHLIRSDVAFRLYLRLQGVDRGIKAGVYAIAPRLGARGVAEVLVEGRNMGVRITIPEGWSLDQIARRVEESVPGQGARFRAYAGRPAAFRDDFTWLPELPAGRTLEGFLFPDTYVVTPGPGAAADLLRLMLARFGQAALPVLQERGAALAPYQRLVMASIVEKEAVHADERPTIAGVFYNRLAQGIPFGSDPTVEYALGRHQDAKGLTLRDVAIDSPYNTYKHAGLPPGPIANPGLASIRAAVHPAQTPLMYFVARGDGSHAFTRTYAEHLAAQARILAGQR